MQLEPSLPKSKLQLLGVAALFIAAKYEEIYPPTLTELVYLTDSTYTKAEVLTKEIDILKKLDYQFNRPHGITFLRRYSTIMGTTTRIHNLAKYILELSLLDHSCSSLLPSKKAAAALFLSRHIMTPYTSPLSIWDEAMAYNTKYRIADFQSEKLKLKRSLREGHSNPKIKTVREKFTSSVLASATTRMALNRI
ncbi:G2/mitotic-specific cyclin-B-like [Halichondria panicea]|uniref:G2/mitotic-specific cyclin-B-like n=1 Tax=Halichondria panicea TaxID=6063 RepID=UPI00312B9833